MKKLTSTLLVATLSLASSSWAAEHVLHAPHWSYEGNTGPQHWASLHTDFSTCESGKNQSPVDLNRTVEGELAPIDFVYHSFGEQVLNNGHTVQVNFAPGSSIFVDDRMFELKQLHFHTPSENAIHGQLFPLEAHLVHADEDGNLAVVGVMFEIGDENPELKKIWQQMPQAGEQQRLRSTVDAENLLPISRGYYRFSGSLTTPPCSEGVRWMVMKNPLQISQEQVEAFFRLMGHANNRPLQPLNGRVVVQ